MDCSKCVVKGCRSFQPCSDESGEYLQRYHIEEVQNITKTASRLVDDGKAGTLNRLEEITEYAKLRGYRVLGVAYCYGMEQEAGLLREYLQKEGFKMLMVSCTVDGVPEYSVNTTTAGCSVSCNPLGQAHALNRLGAEFVILMGLCLGHDVLIQKNLEMDFTTWIVKDRVTMHRPMDALPGYLSAEDLFLKKMDSSFHLISWDKLEERLKSDAWKEEIVLLDLRNETAYTDNGISGSVQCLLAELPLNYEELLPDKSKEIIVYCNGGMQSLYAVMYLSLKGYRNVLSLSGGYSNYLEKAKS